jgi:hypothetical protein
MGSYLVRPANEAFLRPDAGDRPPYSQYPPETDTLGESPPRSSAQMPSRAPFLLLSIKTDDAACFWMNCLGVTLLKPIGF